MGRIPKRLNPAAALKAKWLCVKKDWLRGTGSGKSSGFSGKREHIKQMLFFRYIGRRSLANFLKNFFKYFK